MKTILWDNDGVLVDSEPFFYAANREVLAGLGVELTEAAYRERSLIKGESVLALAGDLPAAELDALRARRNAIYEELLPGSKPRPGIQDCLARLKGRARLGVVTSTPRKHFDIIHGVTGLAPAFDFILTREDFARAKPHPDAYLAALGRAKADRYACLAVEDSERGLAAAKAAGLTCFIVLHPFTAGGDFRAADLVLEDTLPLFPALDAWLAK